MVWPPVWQDAGGQTGLTEYGHMTIGGQYIFENDAEKGGNVFMWYTNYTFIVGKCKISTENFKNYTDLHIFLKLELFNITQIQW